MILSAVNDATVINNIQGPEDRSPFIQSESAPATNSKSLGTTGRIQLERMMRMRKMS